MYTFVATLKDENDAWEHAERCKFCSPLSMRAYFIDTQKSAISFTLRAYIDLSEENLEMDRRVKYTPLAFDNLNLEHLGFLASGFTFPHKQAALFLGSLARQMETAFDNERTGSAADEHEERRDEIVNVDDDL
jgi:hypothetical protein